MTLDPVGQRADENTREFKLLNSDDNAHLTA